MKRLQSYVCGGWHLGDGEVATLVNPSTEEPLAEVALAGIDLAATLAFSAEHGGSALRQCKFAERAEMLAELAKVIHSGREELIELAITNGGNTRSDAKFDIDGASFTLAHYAELGAKLGSRTVLADGEAIQIGRTARFSAQHMFSPRRGVAVHINAFNFPAWGLAEKAACALLAGMPVLCKPATATALVAHRLVELFIESGVLPNGALSLLCGSARSLPGLLRGQDVLAFTGSSVTAAILRASDGVVHHSAHLNVEADSLNAAVLGPDVSPDSETGRLFVADVVRDISQKTGQKCTAIRRVFIPANHVDAFAEAISERLDGLVIGNPNTGSHVRMGPLATQQQLDNVLSGIARLAADTDELYGGRGELEDPEGGQPGVGFFVSPVVRMARDPATPVIHREEVFGPVATVCPYDGKAETASDLVALGAGGLVASIYSDDRAFFKAMVSELAPHHGRLYLGSEKIAAQSSGPGTVLPSLLHGGPGRAGGGEELGGLRGVRLYQQRTAIQGDKSILASLLKD